MVPEKRKERREERKEQRRERRERHRGEKWSILVTVCVSRVRGGIQNWKPEGGRWTDRAWVLERFASK